MIARINKIFQQYPFYVFLLPVFFVLHNYMLYYGMVSVNTALTIVFKIEILFLVFFTIIWLLIKNVHRSAQVMMLPGGIVLFYGVIKDFFSHMPGFQWLGKYSVLLPLLLTTGLLAGRYIMKKRDFSKTNSFQNILLILFLLMEAGMVVFSGASVYMQQNQLVKKSSFDPGSIATGIEKPDVYFLVFDSYPGTRFLKQFLHYDNTPLDALLMARGFYVAGNPRSNYVQTAFSIASTLNFQYLQNIAGNKAPEPKQYNQASLSIDNAAAPAIFTSMGYHLYNLSIFDAGKQPALKKENFLVLPENKMLLYNTLGERFLRDVSWKLSSLKTRFLGTDENRKNKISEIEKEYTRKRDHNNKAIDSLQAIPAISEPRPKFVYAHFYLPHPPFFYDRNGHPVSPVFDTVVKSMEDKAAFLSYLEYSNKVMLAITDAILQHSARPPVIVIQSDHGYRDFKKEMVGPEQYAKNYCAFYFPDRDYTSLYDTFSNVNTFPVIFNKYFKTHIVLQKDATIFMPY